MEELRLEMKGSAAQPKNSHMVFPLIPGGFSLRCDEPETEDGPTVTHVEASALKPAESHFLDKPNAQRQCSLKLQIDTIISSGNCFLIDYVICKYDFL